MAARQRTGQQAHVHWLVPFLMIGGLVCGIALSLGHHFLYNSWDGQIVQSKDQQEWVLRIGTGLAFLIKVFLTSAAGFAYTQFLWHTLKSREVSIEGIDAMFAATNNAGSFFTLELWRKGFPLVLLAGIVWFLPVVAIFPPATLTVQPFVNLSIYDNKPLLTINYSTATPFARLDNLIKEYIAPSNEISRIVSAVSSRGSFLSIPPPRDDYSFNLTFDGPSLSCGPMGGNKSFHDAFDRIFRNKTEYQGIAAEKTAYVGIAPGSSSTSEDGVLYGLKSALGSGVSTYGSKGTGILFSFPMFGEDPARQDAAKHTIACEMFLASHQVNVAFKSGEQFVQVIQITRLPNDTASPELKVVHIAAIAILDALGGILEGKISTSDDGFISIMRTRILSTVFMLTNEMTAAQRTYFGGIDAHPENVTPGNNLSFKDAMEQLVFNVTLSLFACPGLL
ncbi:hypothetical protein QQS21_005300 [Conoideocrella luteorostrata]|uniref:Uncharacterized protein n=1 Tax=Conoideocrella luteorostrata TaxID=1105319 RepID=A0AAJ0FTZ1_9HYPO|nr:hypothetical protein QQS21_005300 [Conoideocrella luteorostrata]